MLQGLTDKLSSYLDPKEIDRIKRAYHFSEKCHLGQMRQSGDPYITHPLAVANILADMQMDPESLMKAYCMTLLKILASLRAKSVVGLVALLQILSMVLVNLVKLKVRQELNSKQKAFKK